MALTVEQEKELKKLKTINSPVPSQKKRIRQLQQLKRTKRTVIPTGPKVVPITDKYPSGKFASPSTKKPKEKKKPLFKLRPDRKTTAKERRDKVDASLKLKNKPINITKKPINKRILKSTTGSVNLPKTRLKQVPTDPPKKKKIISSVRKPKLGTKTGPYKAPEPKKESTFDLLKMLRKVFSPNETISTAKIKKALPDKTTTKQIKSLQAALNPKPKVTKVIKSRNQTVIEKELARQKEMKADPKKYKDKRKADALIRRRKREDKKIPPQLVKPKVKPKTIVKAKPKVIDSAVPPQLAKPKVKPSSAVPPQLVKPKVKKITPSASGRGTINEKPGERAKATIPTIKDQEEINKNVTADPEVTAKLKDPSKSLPAWTNNPIAKEIIRGHGGTKAFFDKDNLSSWIGRNIFGEGDDVTPIDKMKTSVYNTLRDELTSGEMKSDREAFMNTLFKEKGGKVGKKKKKKKQGYKSRKNESIAMRVKKKRTKKQLKSSRNESYGKWGKGKGKGKVNKVYRRGGGKALRGFGKATYSNKLY